MGRVSTVEAALSATEDQEAIKLIRSTLRGSRDKLGHVRRLADASARRVMVAHVVDRASADIDRFVEFALKVGVFGMLL